MSKEIVAVQKNIEKEKTKLSDIRSTLADQVPGNQIQSAIEKTSQVKVFQKDIEQSIQGVLSQI